MAKRITKPETRPAQNPNYKKGKTNPPRPNPQGGKTNPPRPGK